MTLRPTWFDIEWPNLRTQYRTRPLNAARTPHSNGWLNKPNGRVLASLSSIHSPDHAANDDPVLSVCLSWVNVANSRQASRLSSLSSQWSMCSPSIRHSFSSPALDHLVAVLDHCIYFAVASCEKYCKQRVCMSLCLSARISRKPNNQISRNFLFTLYVTVARSSSVINEICYVLTVLWMTSCLQRRRVCFVHFFKWRYRERNLLSLTSSCSCMFLKFFLCFAPIGGRRIAISVSVCLSARIFRKLQSILLTCSRGSVVFWRHCNTGKLCTSGFVADVIFTQWCIYSTWAISTRPQLATKDVIAWRRAGGVIIGRGEVSHFRQLCFFHSTFFNICEPTFWKPSHVMWL